MIESIATSWPDAPTRETARVTAPKSVQEAAKAQNSSQDSPAPSIPFVGSPVAPGFSLTTYQDRDSGRIVVRLFDPTSGDVLLEFPPEGRDLALYNSVSDEKPLPPSPTNLTV